MSAFVGEGQRESEKVKEIFEIVYDCFLQSPYAQLLAATTLTKLISRTNITLPLEQRIDMRKSQNRGS
jgi:hypothetical protein